MTTPRESYQSRLTQYQKRLAALDQRLDYIGSARVAAAVIGVVFTPAVLWMQFISPWWLVAPVAALIALSIAKNQAAAARDTLRRATAFHQRGLDRLDDCWMGKGDQGSRYANEDHLYAADLDLFGKGSLYERLCEAHTREGHDTLAHWLKTPADPSTIRRRQAALVDLSNRLDLRERLALLGEAIRGGIDMQSLAEWAVRPCELPLNAGRRVINAFTVLLPVAALLWVAFDIGPWPLIVELSLQAAFVLWLWRPVQNLLKVVEKRAGDLMRLAGILAAIEAETFSAPALQELQQQLTTDREQPSRHLARLARLIDLLNSRRNQFFIPFALLLFWGTRMAFAIEAWRSRCGPAVRKWFAVIAEMEALLSLAGYAFENPEDSFPDIADSGPIIHGDELRHPLLPRDKCVPNDIRLGPDLRLLVVSGSNMSGKSTFLRTVGTNAVLAFAGAPVRARHMRLSALAIGATLRIQDSLMAGKSRFFSEITRIQRIAEKSKGTSPLLFLLDELLHGTNSHDRGIGAEAIVKALVDRGALGLITTHDLALAHIAENLGPRAENVHFADHLIDGKMVFDYKMQPGVVRHSNAIALMRAVGLPV
jgi:MutS domain V